MYLILMLLFSTLALSAKPSMPDVTLGKYGIEYQSSVQEYQKYIGKEVVYVASSDEKYDYFFLSEGGKYNTRYIISSIKGSNKKITISLKESKGESVVKLIVTNGWSNDLEYTKKDYYWISEPHSFGSTEEKQMHTLPLVFINEFERDKQSLIGREYSSDPQKKHRFVLEDVMFIHSSYDKSDCERIEIGVRFVNPNTQNVLEYKLSDLKDIEDRLNEIGRVITKEHFLATYVIIDILQNPYSKQYYFPKDGLTAVVKNSVDGTIKSNRISTIDRDAFWGDDFGHYKVSLKSVEKPANPKVKYGQTTTITEDSICKYAYVDNFINIILYADNKNLNFLLENNTAYSIKIVWDDAVFVDVNGTTSRVIHNGTRFAQKDESQPSSVIIKGTSLVDFVAPTNRIYYSDGWWQRDLCNTASKAKIETIRLMLPIQIQDVINEYIFAFDVEWEYNHPEYFK